jgi:hypothetical protein
MKTETWMLNPVLVERQALTDAEITEIVRLHNVRENVFKELESLNPTIDTRMVTVCVSMIENLEFALQRAWRFTEDKAMHTWWFMSPHCTCPKNDNWAIFINGGKPLPWMRHEGRLVDEECVLHTK